MSDCQRVMQCVFSLAQLCGAAVLWRGQQPLLRQCLGMGTEFALRIPAGAMMAAMVAWPGAMCGVCAVVAELRQTSCLGVVLWSLTQVVSVDCR